MTDLLKSVAWRRAALKQLEGRTCFPGLDLSTKRDLTCLSLVFPFYEERRRYVVIPFFFLPGGNLDARIQKDRVPYDVWAEHGFITLTGELSQDDNVAVDYSFVRHTFLQQSKVFHFAQCGYDSWNAEQLATELREQHGFEMVEVRQGYQSLSEPTKELVEVLIPSARIEHGDNPVLTSHAGNFKVAYDPAGNMKPDKSGITAATSRFDGIAATIIALRLAMLGDDASSIYEERGLLTI